MLFKIIVILLLLIVLVSLFSGLFFINRDGSAPRGRDTRAARALTVRIAVSLLLFGMLITAYHLGWFGRAS
ncbi:MAG: twin transmembrane helix small protein [Pseudomonadota bacterium]